MGYEAAGKSSLASLLLILYEWVIWTADDPTCICYTDNQRWLLCITFLSWGVVPCDCGYAYSQASSALEITWQCTTKPPRWPCLEVSGFHHGRPERCCSTPMPLQRVFRFGWSKSRYLHSRMCWNLPWYVRITCHFGESQSRGLSTRSLAFMFLVKGLKCSSSPVLSWGCFSLCCNKPGITADLSSRCYMKFCPPWNQRFMFDFSGAKLSFLFHRDFALIYMIESFIKLIILVRVHFFAPLEAS